MAGTCIASCDVATSAGCTAGNLCTPNGSDGGTCGNIGYACSPGTPGTCSPGLTCANLNDVTPDYRCTNYCTTSNDCNPYFICLPQYPGASSSYCFHR
jgi:hypothetical protein